MRQTPGRLLALAIVTAAVLCGGAGRAARRADPIVLGMSAAFTGPSRGLGIELYRGSLAYFSDVNARGGIDGRPILIKAYDDGYNPAPAIYNTIRAVEQDHALLLFNYVGTPTVTRVLPLLKQYQSRSVLLFFPFSGAQPQREPPYDADVFNLRASYRDETDALVAQFTSMGRQRVAIFYQADAYGRSGWDGVRRALRSRRLNLAGEATYQRGAPFSTSFKQQVAILQRAQPDAIITIGAYAACAAFVRDVVDAGWQIPVATVSFVGSENMVNLLTTEGKRTGRDYTSSIIASEVVPSYEDQTLPAVADYRSMMQQYAPKAPPGIDTAGYTLLGYNFAGFEGFLNARVIVEVLRRMNGDIQPARLRAVVESMRLFDVGIDSTVTFGPDRHQALRQIYFSRVEQGRLVPITDWKRWSR